MEDVAKGLLLDDDVDGLKVIEKVVEVPTPQPQQAPVNSIQRSDELVSCLRKEIISVRYVPRETGLVSNPKHIYYGGMANEASRTFTVPMLESNGQYVNVLTNEEKAYLEYAMGLEVNALSIYLKNNNYWDNYQVRLTKGENILDLSNPNDYIKYKVLLANRDYIAPSLQVLQDMPKMTYQFVIVSEVDETSTANKELSSTMESYKEFGRVQEDVDILRVIIETIDGRPTSPNSKLDFLQAQINKLIQANSTLFLKTIKDPLLPNKALIRKAKEAGIIQTRGHYYYYNGTPLCEASQEPTLTMAAKYLGLPKYQEIKFAIEAKLKVA